VLAAFKQAEVELTAIEVKGLSILRVLKTLNKREQTDMIVTEIGTQRVDAHFYKKGSLLLTRSLDIQADNFTHLPNHPALEEVAAALAEGATGPATQGMDIFYNDLQTHLQRSISFVQYSLKERELTIENIYITGVVPHSEYFADILHKRMGSNVTPLNLPAVNQFGGDPSEYVSLSAAGAALRGRISDAN
jgi:Tfp pilus assembly PilM family ATPase